MDNATKLARIEDRILDEFPGADDLSRSLFHDNHPLLSSSTQSTLHHIQTSPDETEWVEIIQRRSDEYCEIEIIPESCGPTEIAIRILIDPQTGESELFAGVRELGGTCEFIAEALARVDYAEDGRLTGAFSRQIWELDPHGRFRNPKSGRGIRTVDRELTVALNKMILTQLLADALRNKYGDQITTVSVSL